MSEFSTSFHIRTSKASTAEEALRKAKMSGLVFGPENGWLTFVPYPNSHGLTDIHDALGVAHAVAEAVGSAVLQFQYAEDHGWSFALVRPDQPPFAFSWGWDEEPPASERALDRLVFDGIAEVSAIEPFLVGARSAADGTPLAYGFADALRLPAYRWLSPDYIEKDAQHFIDAGARKLGRKPAKKAGTPLPPPTKLDLPSEDVSAREALALLRPMMKWCRPPWALRAMSGSSQQGWDFRFYNPELRETIQGYLFPSNGNAGFRSLGYDPKPLSDEEMEKRLAVWRNDPRYAELVEQIEADKLAPPIPTALPEQWLDSREVLAIADTIQSPGELGELALRRVVALDCAPEPAACWSIIAHSTDLTNRIDWRIELNAQTGELLREVLSKPGEGHDSWIILPWRERVPGGIWKDL